MWTVRGATSMRTGWIQNSAGQKTMWMCLLRCLIHGHNVNLAPPHNEKWNRSWQLSVRPMQIRARPDGFVPASFVSKFRVIRE
jgi:hypothetical protein